MKIIALLLALLTAFPALAQTATAESAPAKPSQYAYVLKLIPRLHDDSAWTAEDGELVRKHFVRMKALNESGKVIFAGRTLNEARNAFGIVVLEGVDERQAREIMLADDAVAGGIMTAELFPFTAVFGRTVPAKVQPAASTP